MKVTVLGVTDKSFEGNDGRVAGVELEFDTGDGKRKALTSWIPPVVAEVLKWQAGDEHEIEEYTNKNGKQNFKTPQAPGGKGGGYKGLSASERRELDEFTQERMDRRTALMQAVVLAPKGPPAYTAGIAGIFYEWLRENVPAPSQAGSPMAGPGPAGGGVSIPSSPPASSSGSRPEDVVGVEAQPELVGEASSDASAPTADEVQALYGGQAHLLRAARDLWEDVRSKDDLTPAMLAELARVKAAA